MSNERGRPLTQTLRSPLTPRQHEIFALLCDGLSYRQVADCLGLEATTIRSHAPRIYARLGARGLRQAMVIAARQGWTPWTPPPQERRQGAEPREFDPFATGVLAELDRWLASRFADQDARDALHHGVAAMCARRGVRPARGSASSPMRDLLHHVAVDTLIPT